MNIKNIPIEALIPYEKNTKKHDKKQINNVAESIRQYGFVQPLVIDKNNVVVIGHCRLLAAKQLGMEEVPCVCVDDLTEEQVRALRIVDNKSNESPWDMDLLGEELADLDLSDFDFDFGLGEQKENPYSQKTKIPQYDIQGETPSLFELTDEGKTAELESEIRMSQLSEEEKEFLIKAAQRHRGFNYRKIAEYYANASEEMQSLMERSALVIIDYEDALANGYSKMMTKIQGLIDND